MYETLQSLRDFADEIYGDETSGGTAFYDRMANDAVKYITSRNKWGALYRSDSITVPSTGIISRPPLMQTQESVSYADTNKLKGEEFAYYRSRVAAANFRRARRYYYPSGSKMSAGDQYSADITSGSTVISKDQTGSAGWFDSDDVGKMLVIHGKKSIYEILEVATTGGSESITVFPPVTHDDETGVTVESDPLGVPQFTFCESGGDAYAGTIYFDYYMYHPPLIASTDRLIIPADESVKAYMLAFAAKQSKYDTEAYRTLMDEFEIALRSNIASEGAEPAESIPEGINGAPLFYMKDPTRPRRLGGSSS